MESESKVVSQVMGHGVRESGRECVQTYPISILNLSHNQIQSKWTDEKSMLMMTDRQTLEKFNIDMTLQGPYLRHTTHVLIVSKSLFK